MRKVAVLMGMLGMLGFSAAEGRSERQTATGAETGVLRVSGMACGACAAKVAKEARKLDGVLDVTVSQPKERAEFTFDPKKTSLDAILEAINAKTPFKAEVPAKK